MHLGHECVLITKQFVGRNFICLVGVWKENEKGVVVVNVYAPGAKGAK